MMERNSILVTNSGVNKHTGGGIVGYNLLEALRGVSTVKLLLSNQHFKDGRYEDIYAQCIDPNQYGYSDPFFYDYMASSLIPETVVDLAIFYACPFGKTAEKLKKENFTKIVSDLAPHRIDVSMQEHMTWAGSYPYPHLTNQFLLGLYLKHLRLSDKVIVHSHSSAKYIMETAKLEELPTVIPHGCYLPEQSTILPHPDEFRPGYFGSLGLDKGLMYLIGAWLASEQRKTHRFWVGGGGTECFKDLFHLGEKQMEAFNILGQVQNIGNFFNNISVYVQPSVQDGFGITVLEAMSYGRPVIASVGAGSSELVTDGKEGFRVPMRSPEALKEKMDYFYDNPSEIKRMGAEARRTAEKYSWENIKNQYIGIFKELL
jgi:glycosyltransferase involved in cell wall biosynthesis